MIDFRYHLVSIVSVFLALAVGIVLGAGPLQEELGKTLTKQVNTLRQEKDALRAELDAARADVTQRDEFVAAASPALLSGSLTGRSVVVVTLPGTTGARAEAVTEAVRATGAQVRGPVAVEESWADPDRQSVRDELVAQLSSLQVTSAPDGASPAQRIGAVLARGLVTSQTAQEGQADAGGTKVMTALREAGMVSFDGDIVPRSTLAVVVAPAPDTDLAADRSKAVAESYAALAGALDRADRGTVLVGPPSAAQDGGALRVVREDDGLSRAVSTVDEVDSELSSVVLGLALGEQDRARSGQYGQAAGATAVVPEVQVPDRAVAP